MKAAKLTQHDVERLMDLDEAELWRNINAGEFDRPTMVRNQKRWSVDSVIASRKPYLVIDVRKGRIS